ncbi:MAG: ABC transporter ATP-binding protein [Burkholderiaceae bacterium]
MKAISPLLGVHHLDAGYGKVRILRDVALEVREGEVLAIIGRNGVGKTTLMKTLIGAVGVQRGEIRFDDQPIGGLRPHARARLGIGYVPQGRGIYAKLSVAENLYMGRRIGDGPITDAHYARIHGFFPILRERRAQMAGSMSGGQQQQLALGRALLGKPRLLLLDEPSEGIQPNIVHDMGVLVRRLSRQDRMAVIVVEQNLDLIRLMADRCLVIDHGEVIAELDPGRLADPGLASRYLAI